MTTNKIVPISTVTSDQKEHVELPIEQLEPGPYQPRNSAFLKKDALEALARSIKQDGVLQDITVRKITTNSYEIVAGERRWRAAQMAGLHKVPCIIRDLSNRAAARFALKENLDRDDLSAMEEAVAIKKYIDEFEVSQEEAGVEFGRKRATVNRLLSLLSLVGPVQDLMYQKLLEYGHGRVIVKLPIESQFRFAQAAIKNEWSVREVEKQVQKLIEPTKNNKQIVDPNVKRLQNQLSDMMGQRTEIEYSKTGKGKLVFHFNSLDELDGILSKLPQISD